MNEEKMELAKNDTPVLHQAKHMDLPLNLNDAMTYHLDTLIEVIILQET